VFFFLNVAAHASDATDPTPTMAKAANSFLSALPTAKRERANLPFQSDERLNWHFVPRMRQGLPLKQMSSDERQAALALLKASLSAHGLKKVDTLRRLEEVLRVIERNDRRDAELYYFTVFGEPSEKGAWGWRYEGHHASLNWTIVDGRVAGSSPQFMGANPADVNEGPRKGTRALAAEEDLGRALVTSLNADQTQLAVVSPSAPFGTSAPLGIVTGNSREAAIQDDKGIAYAKLNQTQQGLLLSLIQEYANNQPPAVAQARLARAKAELSNIKFAWMGGREKGQGHYYRIQGSSFLIEYDNTQGNANHIHSVWREFKGDWGKDVLAEHYRTAPHHAHTRAAEPGAKKAKAEN
ncbi:MAG: DUF3500 domain-containing protein, partial [Betaproteobacteria bacterium]|nr:DUF3500 domain-containing protein [Betaproteobacteria bacterium]